MPAIERVLRWHAAYQAQAGVLKDVVEWNLVYWTALFVEDTSRDHVAVNSPVPFVVELEGQPAREFPAGQAAVAVLR